MKLAQHPLVTVAAYPTRGLDVGATENVRRILVNERTNGAAILLISEDLDEIFAIADRIVVIFEGRIVGEMAGEEADLDQIGLMMAGGERHDWHSLLLEHRKYRMTLTLRRMGGEPLVDVKAPSLTWGGLGRGAFATSLNASSDMAYAMSSLPPMPHLAVCASSASPNSRAGYTGYRP